MRDGMRIERLELVRDLVMRAAHLTTAAEQRRVSARVYSASGSNAIAIGFFKGVLGR